METDWTIYASIYYLVSQYKQNEGYEFFHDRFIEDGHREGNNELRLMERYSKEM